MEDLHNNEIKNKLCNLVDKAIDFSKSEDYEKFKQAMTGLEGKNFEDLTDEEKQPLIDIMSKIPEGTLWMTFLLMMFNPFGLKEVNVPFQNPANINGIYGYGWNSNGETFYIPPHIPEACRNCSNHPSNGGSGFCNCILGHTPITY